MNQLSTSQAIRIASETVLEFVRIKPKFVCEYSYVERFANTDGTNSWVTVIGYDNDQWSDFDLICTLTKPTKRQIRQWKRAFR